MASAVQKSMKKTQTQHPRIENIETVARLEQQLLESRTRAERIGDVIGGFAGSMKFVVLHIIIFVAWFVINSRLISAIPAFDPFPFILLSMAVSVEAVLLSTFVLMKQNRMALRADRLNELNLQIDLLSEKETTKNLQLLRRICEHLGIPDVGQDPEIKLLSEDTAVDELAEELRNKMPPRD